MDSMTCITPNMTTMLAQKMIHNLRMENFEA
jgi:hypothetical protein